jgi:hypothetical protein
MFSTNSGFGARAHAQPRRFIVVVAVASIAIASCATAGDGSLAGTDAAGNGSAATITTIQDEADLEDLEKEIHSREAEQTSTTALHPGECTEPEDVGEHQVVVYFPCIGAGPMLVTGFVRDLPPGADPLQFVMEELVAGPSAEERALKAVEALPFNAQYVTYEDGDTLVVDFVASTVETAGITVYKDVGASIILTAGQFGNVVEIRFDGQPLPED